MCPGGVGLKIRNGTVLLCIATSLIHNRFFKTLSSRALCTLIVVLISWLGRHLVGCYKKLTCHCSLPQLKYKEVYQRNKSNCMIKPDAVHIKAAKDAYKVNTNVSFRNFCKPERGFVSFCGIRGLSSHPLG